MRKWSKDSIRFAIQRWAEAHAGDPPTTNEMYADPSLPDPATVRYYYDKVSDAIRDAGYRPRGKGCPHQLIQPPLRLHGKLVGYSDYERILLAIKKEEREGRYAGSQR